MNISMAIQHLRSAFGASKSQEKAAKGSITLSIDLAEEGTIERVRQLKDIRDEFDMLKVEAHRAYTQRVRYVS